MTVLFDLMYGWFGLVCFANKNKIVSCHTANSKPVKREVNSTMILPPLEFPVSANVSILLAKVCSYLSYYIQCSEGTLILVLCIVYGKSINC